MDVALAYARHTSCASTLSSSALDFATNLRRPPVAFRGRVREPLLLRQLLLALHTVVISDYSESERWSWQLDPVITVHPDCLFFEAFSNDESSYARLDAPLDRFEPEGPPSYGTTNIDFTWALRSELERMRSSRETSFGVGAGGFAVATAGPGGGAHIEQKVELPDSWLKGFLQVQSALALRPLLFDVRPADLLTAIAVFQDQRPPRPPHGLRYELSPGEPVRLAVEPWDTRVTLHGARYDGYPRVVRVWGRKRLELLRAVLPYSERVTVGLLGRGLPHLYICHCGGYRFTLALSGWTRNDWAAGSAFDELAPRGPLDAEQTAAVYACLARHLVASRRRISEETGLAPATVEHALYRLCRGGRAIIEPTGGRFRLRELFAEPVDLDTLFPPDPRGATARRLLDAGAARLDSVQAPAPDGTGRREHKAVAVVQDGGPQTAVAAVDLDGRLRFGQCSCAFFQRNIMSRGPCEHILAARLLLDQHLAEAATPAGSADGEGF
ncbi:MAG TPA: SWIM zinc finger family protein [Roseiflexaceae bacterium]|nr:SWIM zinc finger family protein [Roseiflexaceae bacterium]